MRADEGLTMTRSLIIFDKLCSKKKYFLGMFPLNVVNSGLASV